MECFSFVNRALKLDMAPVLVVATNHGIVHLCGMGYKIFPRIWFDFLDSLFIVVNSEEENAKKAVDMMKLLARNGTEHSL